MGDVGFFSVSFVHDDCESRIFRHLYSLLHLRIISQFFPWHLKRFLARYPFIFSPCLSRDAAMMTIFGPYCLRSFSTIILWNTWKTHFQVPLRASFYVRFFYHSVWKSPKMSLCLAWNETYRVIFPYCAFPWSCPAGNDQWDLNDQW